MTITLDDCGSGRNQSRENPFGDLDADRLHSWMFDHVDENNEERTAITPAGAYTMGRKMFASDEDEWDLDWKGWCPPRPSRLTTGALFEAIPRSHSQEGSRA